MSPSPAEMKSEPHWSIEEAEAFLCTLTGVISTRIVARPGGEIDEIHVLTTEEVAPKQTVRNVESALLAHFDLTLDHRKISVAQTSRPIPDVPAATDTPMSVVIERNLARGEERILFRGQRQESEDAHGIKISVRLEWRGQTFEGLARAADLARPRLEATAEATLRAVEAVAAQAGAESEEAFDLSLSLDGLRVVDTVDRKFVLVAVHAMSGRDIVSLAGTARVEDRPDQSVVLATLQAVDRWVRGKIP